MVYRDPFAAQSLIDQGTEEQDIADLLGTKPKPKPYQPPGPGMVPGTPNPFNMSQNPQGAPPAQVSPETQRLIDATNKVAGIAPSPGGSSFSPDPQDPKGSINARFANTGDPFEDMRQRRVTDTAEQGLHQEGAQFVNVGPAKRLGIGRQDEQMMEALGPQYAAEANKLAMSDSATPGTMYAKINGQQFYGTPGQRVSRQALRGVAERVAMDQLKQEGIDTENRHFGQRMDLAKLPGQQKSDLFDKASAAEMAKLKQQQEYESPERQQRLKQGEQKLTQGDLAIDQSRFDQTQRNDPKAKAHAAADQQMIQLAGMPQTPAVRALMAQLYPQTTVGSRVSPEIAAGFGKELGRNPADQGAEIDAALQDPEVQASLGGAIQESGGLAKKVEDMTASPLNLFAYTKDSDITDLESRVERGVQALMRKNPTLNEDAVREKVTQQLEGAVGNTTNVGRKLRKAGQKKTAP